MKFASVVVVGWLAVLGWMFWPPSNPEADQVVTQWLDDQRAGLSGTQYWVSDADPVILYAVRSWEVLTSSADLCTVRVESSTREGIPIIRLWRISLDGDKIESVEPAQG